MATQSPGLPEQAGAWTPCSNQAGQPQQSQHHWLTAQSFRFFQGCLKVSSSHIITPQAYTSLEGVAGEPVTISGDWVAGEKGPGVPRVSLKLANAAAAAVPVGGAGSRSCLLQHHSYITSISAAVSGSLWAAYTRRYAASGSGTHQPSGVHVCKRRGVASTAIVHDL